jgi:hypothetical protein
LNFLGVAASLEAVVDDINLVANADAAWYRVAGL